MKTIEKPCGGCSQEEEPLGAHLEINLAPVDALGENESVVQTGAISYIKAKIGGKASSRVQKLRFATCVSCEQMQQTADDKNTSTRLFREIHGVPYCGDPWSSKLIRNQFLDGCGCDLSDKVKYTKSECPRKQWGPGVNFPGASIVMRTEVEAQRIPDFLDVHIMSKDNPPDLSGIGDTLSFLPIIRAIKTANPDRTVRYVISKATYKWGKLGFDKFAFEDDIERIPGEVEIFSTELTFAGMDVDAQERDLKHRQGYWESRFGVTAEKMKVKATVEAKLDIKQRLAEPIMEDKPIVALTPFSNAIFRDWPLRHWLALQKMLKANGVYCFIIDGPQAERTRLFDCMRFWGYGPEATVALLHYAWLHVGNDSSMCHLAGLMQKSTLALCSSTHGPTVFGWYDSVEVMQTTAHCSACYYRESHGFQYPCAAGCNAMWDLKPEIVFARVMQKLTEVRALRT